MLRIKEYDDPAKSPATLPSFTTLRARGEGVLTGGEKKGGKTPRCKNRLNARMKRAKAVIKHLTVTSTSAEHLSACVEVRFKWFARSLAIPPLFLVQRPVYRISANK